MQRLGNPYPIFLDATGALADGNQIYLGVAQADPQVQPIVAYWDPALTQVAEQPLRTIGGKIVNGSTPADIFFAESDYSLRQLDPFGVLVYYSASVFAGGVQYQPLDTDLTAIAALATTPFGRQLLTLASAQQLANATGIPNPLPLTGGQVSGNITQQGGGVHLFHVDSNLGTGRVFQSLESAGDPTSLGGDIWLAWTS